MICIQKFSKTNTTKQTFFFIYNRCLTDIKVLLCLTNITHILIAGDFEVVREMKEKMCYVAEDYPKEITRSECFPDVYKAYELPDGNCIAIGKERFDCPEMLFQPSKVKINLLHRNYKITYTNLPLPQKRNKTQQNKQVK